MDEEELYTLLAFLRDSKNRQKIMKFLKDEEDPQTPTDIAEETEIHRNHVSNQLGQLKEKELVNVLNPDAARHRYYRLTKKGDKLARKIESIEEE